MLKGSIDALHNGRCYGWAVDSKSPCAIEIEVFIDGESIGRRLANDFRPDLEQAGLLKGGLRLRSRCRRHCVTGGTTR